MTEALAQTSLHQVFDIWQPRYAERGIPTFPVAFTLCDGKIDKRPAVRGYMKLGLRASTELTRKFVDAAGIGFALGSKTGFAVADVDTPDESAVADVLAHYGSSPLIARTPSGGFHVYYKHNGEQHRRVRHPYWRERGVPVDVLANGFVVAPPSRSPKGSYRFVQGYIDDLLRLPTMRALAAAYNIDTSPSDRRSPLCDMRDHDGRNNALFMALGPIARDIHRACGTREQLLGNALEHNAQCAQPMEHGEVSKIVDNVWSMTREGRNYIGMSSHFCLRVEDVDMDANAFKLLAFLRAHQGLHSQFWCTNALAERFGWDRRRFAEARRTLIEQGHIVLVRQAGRGHPALFRWGRY